MKMLKESLKVLTPEAYESKDNFFKAFNQYAETCGLPIIYISDQNVDIPNKSAPALDTLDFDEVSKFFDDDIIPL